MWSIFFLTRDEPTVVVLKDLQFKVLVLRIYNAFCQGLSMPSFTIKKEASEFC